MWSEDTLRKIFAKELGKVLNKISLVDVKQIKAPIYFASQAEFEISDLFQSFEQMFQEHIT
jgi:hypothetical protein